MSSRRVLQQPAFILHHRPFRDTSMLVDVISRDHGKLALVARGVRSQKSRLKGLLRPFQPLKLSWVLRSDLGTLTGAEIDSGPLSLTGDSLMSGYYVNELLLNLLHRHDPQPETFAAYSATMRRLAATHEPAPVLRAFEIELLGLLGYAVNLEYEAASHDAIDAKTNYEYRVEQGPARVSRNEGPMVFSGAQLIAVREQRFDDVDTLRAAGRLLRRVIEYHLGGKELMSRKVLRDLHRGRLGAQHHENSR